MGGRNPSVTARHRIVRTIPVDQLQMWWSGAAGERHAKGTRPKLAPWWWVTPLGGHDNKLKVHGRLYRIVLSLFSSTRDPAC